MTRVKSRHRRRLPNVRCRVRETLCRWRSSMGSSVSSRTARVEAVEPVRSSTAWPGMGVQLAHPVSALAPGLALIFSHPAGWQESASGRWGSARTCFFRATRIPATLSPFSIPLMTDDAVVCMPSSVPEAIPHQAPLLPQSHTVVSLSLAISGMALWTGGQAPHTHRLAIHKHLIGRHLKESSPFTEQEEEDERRASTYLLEEAAVGVCPGGTERRAVLS
jgi:hypothetical protein